MQVHRLRDPAFDVNLYVVDAGDAWLLVDTGTGQAHDRLLHRLREVVDPARVDTIYLTHWHADHVGGVARLAEATGARVLMHEDEADAVREGDATRTLGAFMGLDQAPCPVEDVREGEVVEVGDASFAILLTPGHSPAHTVLWEPEHGVLLGGDMVFEGGSFGRVDFPGCDPEEMVRSLERLAELPVRDLYPGHMGPITGGAEEEIAQSARNASMMLLGRARR